MIEAEEYFFCGIGGSGMLPLALLLRARGCPVEGSDRMLDQGRTPEKFDFLRRHGIVLHPQNGSGIARPSQILVTSTAVEETVADVQAARRIGARLMRRADLLAQVFHAAPYGIAVGGTSGKSTTTAMIGWILHRAGRAPTIVNGAVMQNFVSPEIPYAGAIAGDGSLFVSEVDESDGSIALYRPRLAVLTNVALDHKSLDELRSLFGAFIGRAEQVVVNRDNAEAWGLAATLPTEATVNVSLSDPAADLVARELVPEPGGIAFDVIRRTDGTVRPARLQVPGAHNVANALVALAASGACGVPLDEAVDALATFTGLRRRLERVGMANDITVIDDFAHNPDKIAATLATLHAFPGRLLVLFQPHGFGPLRLMKDALVECFAQGLGRDDVLILPDPVYFGGTVDRTVTSHDVADAVRRRGRQADALGDRETCGDRLVALARPGDRIVVMGARDDTLADFARSLLARL